VQHLSKSALPSMEDGAYTQGFGRVSLDVLERLYADGTDMVIKWNSSLYTGESDRLCVRATAGGWLSVALVWTDPPGALNSVYSLVNNLDLIVVGERGTTYYGNGRTSADMINNVEVVRMTAAVNETIVVSVNAAEVPLGKQEFALAVVGGGVVEYEGGCTVTTTACPFSCHDHGECSSGQCLCTPPYFGSTCEREVDDVIVSKPNIRIEGDVPELEWKVYNFSFSLSQIREGVGVAFKRKNKGDADFFLRYASVPTMFTYDEKDTHCDICAGPARAGAFYIPKDTQTTTAYLGVLGRCCGQADFEVAVINHTVTGCDAFGLSDCPSLPSACSTGLCALAVLDVALICIACAILVGGIIATVCLVKRRTTRHRNRSTIHRTIGMARAAGKTARAQETNEGQL